MTTLDKATLEAILAKIQPMANSAAYQRNKRDGDGNDQYHYWCGKDDAFVYVIERIEDELQKLEAQPS